MKNLIKYFIKYPIAGNLLMGLILLMGLVGLMNIKSAMMPQVDPGVIIVSAQYPGASPEEIEKGITLKIENNLKGLSGINKVRSISQENFGQVTIELESGFNADVVLQDVKNAVDGIISFPSGMEPPNVRKMEFTDVAVQFALSGDIDLKLLKQYARNVEDELRLLNGISKVELSGFPDEEIQISFREDDLQRYDLTLDEAYNAVKNANIDITGGTLRGNSAELRVRARQKKYYADQMKNIVLRTSTSGGLVRLGDVASVEDTWAEDPNRRFVDGNPAAIITVLNTVRDDVIDISNSVHHYIEQFNQSHQDVKATLFDDRTDDIKSMQQILVDNGIIGIVLVLVFLSFALNFRLSFWVSISIPMAFLGMFMMAALMGITMNRISLFGMILVIGILVDDGIVVTENIYQHYERGKTNLKSAFNGTIEVLPAVFSAVLTTIVAFSTFFFLDGVFGQLFSEMAFVVVISLTFSLLESAFILPAHVAHSKALKRERKISRLEISLNNIVHKLRDNYFAPLLRFCLRNKLLAVSVPVALLFITIGAFQGGIIKSGDVNAEDNSYIKVNLEMPPGTTEAVTQQVLNRIVTAAASTAKSFNSRHTEETETLKTLISQIESSSNGNVVAILQESKLRTYHSVEFANAWRKQVGEIPEALRVNFVEESHFGKPVSISIISHNLKELEAAKETLKDKLGALKGLKNIVDDYETGMREINITLKDKAYLLGLNIQEVMALVRQGIFGAEVQRLHRGQDEVKIWVRLQKEDRSSIGKLENMRIRLDDGRKIPLKEIAHLNYERNLVSINHLDGRRQVTVEADALNSSIPISQIQEDIETRIIPELKKKYSAIDIRFGGREERMAKTMTSIKIIAPVMMLLLITIVIITFRSFSQAFLVFALLPFGFIGIGWGHFIHGYSVDMPSYFGVVALMGIMVNDAIVLISTFNNRLKKGESLMTAVTEATLSRFRPILLTSLTTIAGLAPLILTDSSEAHLVIPMAISVSYGLIISTSLTLIMLPVMLVAFNKVKVFIKTLLTGKRPTLEEVEPAVKEIATTF